ncbi:MAG: stage IV sporulation protein A [Clostridiales bacterium]|nr:stage IV sporulation protein A [Clostridiales bacterium]
MEAYDIFRDMAERTGGNIYIGVVGPVRTGKSTFVKKFMDLLILPHIQDEAERQRTIDELPQSGAGRTVMTTEPKFVPDNGVAIALNGLNLRVRLVDSVGFPVMGAVGYQEGDQPRMVTTPWFDHDIPFEEAAEVGTQKIIADHSTVGVVVTADGSFGELPREAYQPAEERAIQELKKLGKPFLVLLNSQKADAEETQSMAARLAHEYGVTVLPVNLPHITRSGLQRILEELLYEFPIKELEVRVPLWVEVLEISHWLRQSLQEAVGSAFQGLEKVRDIYRAMGELRQHEYVQDVRLESADMGTGVLQVVVEVPEEVYQEVLRELAGFDVTRPELLLKALKEYREAKGFYDRFQTALREVEETGYGVVPPLLSDMEFEEPQLLRKGHQFGVRLAAKAPAYHILKTEVTADYSPILGTESQSGGPKRVSPASSAPGWPAPPPAGTPPGEAPQRSRRPSPPPPRWNDRR